MQRGRPRSFDKRDALERAMRLFWRQGYEKTALSELLDEMGISRQSLYDTFGNKRSLFVQSIEYYRDEHLAQALGLLAREGSPIGNVRAAVRFFERLALGEQGCLVANAMVEVAPHDEEIAELLSETLGLLQTSIRLALERAQRSGELSQGKSPLQLSRALTSAVLGLAVTGKLRPGRSALRDVHDGTLAMLD
ncbi:MAG: TetR/AcrR family transcriptional regulator [Myxococcota bacterium]